MYDMYKDCPIQTIMSEGLFNAKIEREMMQYLTYKGLKPKDGLLELIEYLHQKKKKRRRKSRRYLVYFEKVLKNKISFSLQK